MCLKCFKPKIWRLLKHCESIQDPDGVPNHWLSLRASPCGHVRLSRRPLAITTFDAVQTHTARRFHTRHYTSVLHRVRQWKDGCRELVGTNIKRLLIGRAVMRATDKIERVVKPCANTRSCGVRLYQAIKEHYAAKGLFGSGQVSITLPACLSLFERKCRSLSEFSRP